MTIQVFSNDAPAAKAPAAAVEPPPSAPEAKASEQNESTESDTEETEAKDESEDTEGDEPEESKEAAKDKPKKKGGFQRRIDKLNARYAAAQQESDHWKALALKNKDAGETKGESVEKKPATAEGKPNPDSFETHVEYVEALTDWKTEQKFKEREQRAEKSKLESEQEKFLKSHTERVKSFAEKTEDFADVLSEVDDIPVSPTIQELIITSENGPELMYELAKNRDEYARICKLSPLAAARELGKIESKINAKASDEKQEPKKLTKAPKPIDPVGGAKAAVTKSLDDPNLSQAEYEAIRRKQLAARKSAW